MTQRLANIIAVLSLIIMAVLMIGSAKHDSLTFDEKAHIAAGYSYLFAQDYRVNPEHPPLAKDLAAIPLMLGNFNWPQNSPMWTKPYEDISVAWWQQFDLGNEFLFKSGNNADKIIFMARMPMIILTLLLGIIIFYIAKKYWGHDVAAIATFFYAFSPDIIAHGRLVTIDVVAAFGAVISVFTWIEFLKNPNWKNVFWAGLAFGIAMICKYSLILLIPVFIILTIIYPLIIGKKVKDLWPYLGKSLVIGLIGMFLIVWPAYYFNMRNMPQAKINFDANINLRDHKIPIAKNIDLWMLKSDAFRPIGYWAYGVLMAGQRTLGGNTTFFMGEISSKSWAGYFPTLYLIKFPLAFHLLCLLALIWAICSIQRPWFKYIVRRKIDWVKNNFELYAMVVFVVIYWLTAILGNLNIGLRHVLPTFPFIFIFTAIGMNNLINCDYQCLPKTKKIGKWLLIVLFAWYGLSTIFCYPYYISHCNELVGGPANGYKYAVDSNYDWGQDFNDLIKFVEKNKVYNLKLHYFGGADPNYYIPDRIKYYNAKESGPTTGWIAISANEMMGGMAKPVKGYEQNSDYYKWLLNYQPVARAGYSIFIYNIPEK